MIVNPTKFNEALRGVEASDHIEADAVCWFLPVPYSRSRQSAKSPTAYVSVLRARRYEHAVHEALIVEMKDKELIDLWKFYYAERYLCR